MLNAATTCTILGISDIKGKPLGPEAESRPCYYCNERFQVILMNKLEAAHTHTHTHICVLPMQLKHPKDLRGFTDALGILWLHSETA